MAEKLQIIIDGDASKLISALKTSGVEIDALGGKTKKAGSGFQVFQNDLASFIGPIGLVGLAVGAAKGAFELTMLGAASQKAQIAFENLSGGELAAAENMAALKEATRGAVSEMDAQVIASKALALGLASNAGELEKTVEIARRLDFTGMGVENMMSNLALTLSNMSYVRLDQMGISAAKVRAQVAELTAAGMDAEQAFKTAVFAEAETTIARLGEETYTTADSWARLTASVKDYAAEVGEAMNKSGAMSGVFDALSNSLDSLSETSKQQVALQNELGATSQNDLIAKLQSGKISQEELQAAMDRVNVAAEEQARAMNGGSAFMATYAAGARDAAAAQRELATAQQLAAATEASTSRYSGMADMYGVSGGRQTLDEFKRAQEAQRARAQAQRMMQDNADEMGGNMGLEQRVADETAAAETSARAWESSYNEAAQKMSSAVDRALSGITNLDGIGIEGIIGPEANLNEDARRLAAVAARGMGEEAAAYIQRDNPQLFAKLMASDNPQELARQMVGDFSRYGIGAASLVSEAEAVERVKRILLGEADMETLKQKVLAQLTGQGFNAAQIQSAFGKAGLGGEQDGQPMIIDMAPTANGMYEALGTAMAEASESSNIFAPLTPVWATQLGEMNLKEPVGAFLLNVANTIKEDDAAKNMLVTILFEAIVSAGLIKSNRGGM